MVDEIVWGTILCLPPHSALHLHLLAHYPPSSLHATCTLPLPPHMPYSNCTRHCYLHTSCLPPASHLAPPRTCHLSHTPIASATHTPPVAACLPFLLYLTLHTCLPHPPPLLLHL